MEIFHSKNRKESPSSESPSGDIRATPNPRGSEELAEAEILAIAAALLLQRSPSAGRYGRVLACEAVLPREEHE